MIKKFLLSIILIFLITINCFAIALNQFGHITHEIEKEDISYSMENGVYTIRCDGHAFEGNSFMRTASGYITLITIEDNVSSVLRFYDHNGILFFKNTYNKIINISLSDNREYIAFFDGEEVAVLKADATEMQQYPGSIIFAVDDFGNPVYYNSEKSTIIYKSDSILVQDNPHSILFWNHKPVICDRNSIYILSQGKLIPIYTSRKTLFEIKIINSELYFVEREERENSFEFTMYHFENKKIITQQDKTNFTFAETKTHQTIIAPLKYGMITYPFPIGNSYAEIQQYGGNPYLHPGVDFLGDDYENVYVVKSGYIKAILTTGGSAYWRIGISNENTSAESEGYLYAHLNQGSIPYMVGDQVQVGNFLGTLYPWGYYDFTHIHFARITCSGSTWSGNWWTTDNPLPGVINFTDSTPPVFENAYGTNLFAFRTENGIYLDPNNLMGEIDIIAKCHDIANSTWRIDVWDMRFKLHPASNPGSTIYERFSFAWDMPLDTYLSGSFDNMVLYTLYSRDGTCYSIGDYTNREYYHIITNSDGDSVITQYDQDENLDTSQFPDGQYILEVIARDCSMNETSASMTVTFDNVSVNEPSMHENLIQSISPNPFIPDIHGTVCFSLYRPSSNKAIQIFIYNSKGQHIKTILAQEPVDNFTRTYWNGFDEHGIPVPSGIYFSNIVLENRATHLGKIIILR